MAGASHERGRALLSGVGRVEEQMAPYVIAGVAAAGVVWIVITFNVLVRHRNLVQEAWSGIDVQLRRRANLIPNLVDTVKAYSAHERGTLEEVTRVRAQAEGAASVKDRQAVENALSQVLRRLFALAEAYPDLKASQTYLALQDQLVEVEDQVQYARRYYNGTVRDYNIRAESLPNNLVAAVFRFKRADFFELETATARRAPEVKMS